MNSLYKKILDEYQNDKRITILCKIKGKKGFDRVVNFFFPNGAPKVWLSMWNPIQKRNARGFVYSMKQNKNIKYSFKLITQRGKKNTNSVIGEWIPEDKINNLLQKFKCSNKI